MSDANRPIDTMPRSPRDAERVWEPERSPAMMSHQARTNFTCPMTADVAPRQCAPLPVPDFAGPWRRSA